MERPSPSYAVDDDAQLASMFERGWALYLSGEKDQALAVFERALKGAERAAGAPEGDRQLRVDLPPWIETYAVGDRVLVPTPFLTLLVEPSKGRVERVVRALQSPWVIRGTSLILARHGPDGTQLIDGKTLTPIVSWDGIASAHPSDDGALLAVEMVVPGEGNDRDVNKIVVFDTRERRVVTEVPVPERHHVSLVDAGRILVNGGEVRDARSGRLLFSQKDVIGSPAFARSYVAFVAPDRAVVLAERETWKPIAKTRACAAAGPLAFDPNGKWLAIGGADTACLVEIPSLRVRRSHLGRRLPIFQHRELERPLINLTIPTFVGNGRVLALTSLQTHEASLFKATTGRELFHDVGELYVPENSDAYVIGGTEPSEKIAVGPTGTIERHTLTQAEGIRLWRAREHAPAPELVDRVRANLCALNWDSLDWGRRPAKRGFWVVPREACRR